MLFLPTSSTRYLCRAFLDHLPRITTTQVYHYHHVRFLTNFSTDMADTERKSNVKLNALIDIERTVQKQWDEKKVFEMDALSSTADDTR